MDVQQMNVVNSGKKKRSKTKKNPQSASAVNGVISDLNKVQINGKKNGIPMENSEVPHNNQKKTNREKRAPEDIYKLAPNGLPSDLITKMAMSLLSKNRLKIAQKTSLQQQQNAQDLLFSSLGNLENGLPNQKGVLQDPQCPMPDLPFDPSLMFKNFQKLINQSLTENVESSDDEEEYIEYVFKPRPYFLHSICQFCKIPSSADLIPCQACLMTRYCSAEHMISDANQHVQICRALSTIAKSYGGHIFNNCGHFDFEQFRAFRVSVLNKCEEMLGRLLEPFEKEIVLFPRLCGNKECREWRPNLLRDCQKCGLVSFCRDKPDHEDSDHHRWCRHFSILKKLILHQYTNGKIDPPLPMKIHREPLATSTMDQVLKKIYTDSSDLSDDCDYTSITQVATAPLTAWYAAKSFGVLPKDELTIHLIGAELQFEADVINKWELFFLHISPSVKHLNIVFIGPELNTGGLSLDALTKAKVCSTCRKDKRSIKHIFEDELYHDYTSSPNYLRPDLVCYFNPGLYRSTGFNFADTWPETIKATSRERCPVVVTSYTEYESPLDFRRYIKEAERPVEVLLPPTLNPFTSQKPERNFISEEMAPMIFKNYYCFIVN